MPSVIGTDSESGVNVAANYLKAKPSTRFATRQLAFYDVNITGVHTDFRDADSAYSRAIRAVQQNAEIYAVGTPASDHFIVVVAQDTASDGSNTDAGLNDMAQSLSTATGGTVTAKHLSGNGFASGLMHYGDTRDGSNYKDESDAI